MLAASSSRPESRPARTAPRRALRTEARATRLALCLALLRVGFAEPDRSPGLLVRSYRTVSPLPHRSLRASELAGATSMRRFIFCGTFPDLATGGSYPPPCPLKPGLSSANRRVAGHAGRLSQSTATAWLTSGSRIVAIRCPEFAELSQSGRRDRARTTSDRVKSTQMRIRTSLNFLSAICSQRLRDVAIPESRADSQKCTEGRRNRGWSRLRRGSFQVTGLIDVASSQSLEQVIVLNQPLTCFAASNRFSPLFLTRLCSAAGIG